MIDTVVGRAVSVPLPKDGAAVVRVVRVGVGRRDVDEELEKGIVLLNVDIVLEGKVVEEFDTAAVGKVVNVSVVEVMESEEVLLGELCASAKKVVLLLRRMPKARKSDGVGECILIGRRNGLVYSCKIEFGAMTTV
jgi:hypothetical protein